MRQSRRLEGKKKVPGGKSFVSQKRSDFSFSADWSKEKGNTSDVLDSRSLDISSIKIGQHRLN